MKNLRYFSLILLLALLAPVFQLAAASGREVRTVAAFTKLSLSNSVRVILRQGSPQRVEVEASAADLARLETTVENSKLHIGTKREEGKMWNNSGRFEGPVTVYVTMPTVSELSVSGSGQLTAETDIKADALSLSISGSGKITVPKLKADKLNTSVSGSGEITLAGSCPQHEARISGSGNVRASDLRTETSAIRISGSGDGRLYASRSLEASIAGSGSVYVRGGANVSSKIAGSGRVHKE
ncbi:head GIN domain-containing protein [Hymenobacter sediminicola]|uniref:DUF2807 domain-containing protein n=1 Tax=Hymenobacter sediminicola TaxID=2761579 RepID=A0A7G7W6N1_9BACT|nr:head GIN domain-containing protein [Hymenobacter sediminicola]QNH62024.1 DUF2807 domain-containing protein [Hymenobacter sediminicola]